jgi:hypothetical protein
MDEPLIQSPHYVVEVKGLFATEGSLLLCPQEDRTPKQMPAPEPTPNVMLERNEENLSQEDLFDYEKILQARKTSVSLGSRPLFVVSGHFCSHDSLI